MSLIGEAAPAKAAADVIKEGSDAGFIADVVEASRVQPVIVDFWATWCGPCRQLTPALEKAVKAAGGAVKLVKIDVDKNPVYAGQLRVQSIPTVYAFDGGKPVDGFTGALPESQVKAFVQKLIKTPPVSELDELLARRDGWAKHGGESHKVIDLAPLSDTDAAAVMHELLAPCGDAPAVEDLVEGACTLAGGNPALLERMVRIFLDMGVLESVDESSGDESSPGVVPSRPLPSTLACPSVPASPPVTEASSPPQPAPTTLTNPSTKPPATIRRPKRPCLS